MADVNPITVARFWSKVSVVKADTKCWEWQGSVNASGYGSFRVPQFGRVTLEAHRVSYLICNGDFPPDGQVVRHTCDNPICVNPFHLEPGTKADNARDMVERGRCSTHDRSGEKNGAAKLSREQVDVIRARIARGETNMRIARDYGVTHAMISRIRVGKAWV
jgi:hypothetical protein